MGTIKELNCLTIYGNPLPKDISKLFGALLIDYIDDHFKKPKEKKEEEEEEKK